MIVYSQTANSSPELPEIKGYKPQFRYEEPGGDELQQVQQPIIIQATQEPTQEVVEEKKQEQYSPNEWSDIRSIIKRNEGFTSTAKKSFNEPNPTVGYGFFNILPDGTKITDGMMLSKAQADKQLDIAIEKNTKQIQSYLNKYGVSVSPEQFNILLDLGYHGGNGLVDKLLRQSNGDHNQIANLLQRYATTAKYGDASISKGLRDRARRRAEGWRKYPVKGKYGLKIPNVLLVKGGKRISNFTNGEKTFTEQCAEFQNTMLRNAGYRTSGSAWNLNDADLVYSGYIAENKPTKYNKYKVQKYNWAAAKKLANEFDTNQLDTNKVYVTNMYYNESPYQETAYNEGRDSITGTHTGYMWFNPDTSQWEVIHNIHGTVHVDPLSSIKGKKYGVTAIYQPKEKNVIDKAIDLGKRLSKSKLIQNISNIQAK